MRPLVTLIVAVTLGACSTIDSSPSASGSARPDVEPLAGTITFGSPNGGEAIFRLNAEVGWTATLSAPVDGTKVNIVVTDSEGGELFGYEQFIPSPGATVLDYHLQLGRSLREPGAYVMRYEGPDGEVLAQGEFQLVR